MSNIIPFSFDQKQVRVIQRDGEPWFVAVDVCKVLGLSNPTEAVRHLDDDEKSTLSITEGKYSKANAVNESGLYTLVMRSNKPEAKKFRKWVTSTVLPSIRKTGAYTLDVGLKALEKKLEAIINSPDTQVIADSGDTKLINGSASRWMLTHGGVQYVSPQFFVEQLSTILGGNVHVDKLLHFLYRSPHISQKEKDGEQYYYNISQAFINLMINAN
jgi:prophage antirepressor-like protein